jgi:hypothetical protein
VATQHGVALPRTAPRPKKLTQGQEALKQQLLGSGDPVQNILASIGGSLLSHAGVADIFDWLDAEGIKTERGLPFLLEDRKYMVDILTDYTPVQVWEKAAQVGMSTVAIFKALHSCKYKKWNVIYTLPASDDVDFFLDSKVRPLIDSNPVLQDWLGTDTKKTKKIGDSFVFFRGTFLEKEGIMISADLNIHDELDRSNVSTVGTYESRLAASDYGGQWYFSNPSKPFHGVDAYWLESDQKHWFVTCEKCGYEWYMDWPHSICPERHVYQCQKCRAEIPAAAIRDGRWVKKFQNRTTSGYWINHMMAPWISAERVERAFYTKDRPYFFNMVMGKPYAGSDITVTKEVFKKAANGKPMKGEICMGIDQGKEFHVVVGPSDGVGDLFVVKEWHEVSALIKRFQPDSVVIDALPDTRGVVALQKQYPFRVYGCYFKGDPNKPEPMTFDDKTCFVNAARDRCIDNVIADWTDSKLYIYDGLESSMMFDLFCKQWESLYLGTATDKSGNTRRVWTSSRADHFALATTYWWLATRRTLSLREDAPEISPAEDDKFDDSVVSSDDISPLFRPSGKDWFNDL